MKNADELFKQIPIGHANAMYVPNSNIQFRELVRNLNNSGEEVIVNNRGGYFIPDFNDPDDVALVWEYLERERRRAVSTLYKVGRMQQTLNRKAGYTLERIDIDTEGA